jgi:hypothetical protein
MKKIAALALTLTGVSMMIQNTCAQVNYNLVCVDSVWYSSNPLFINVRIYNGDTLQMNYPSVQIVSPANDTIGNPSNSVTYFAQAGNSYQTYTDTITQPGISDFSNYTFLISEGFGDTTAVIHWCSPLGLEELMNSTLKIFPDPAGDELYAIGHSLFYIDILEIYDVSGNVVLRIEPKANSKVLSLDISGFTRGVYFLRATDGKNIFGEKFMKQ